MTQAYRAEAAPFPPAPAARKAHIAAALAFVCNRPLLRQSYCALMPEHFETMGRRSGVAIGACIPTQAIVPGAAFPGDIDLLLIPYEDDRLVVARTLALEVASTAAGRAAPRPSQAAAILAHGFPYCAVAHVAAYDSRPMAAWRQLPARAARLAATGERERFQAVRLNRQAAGDDASVGWLSAYIAPDCGQFWLPAAAAARENPRVSAATLDRIARFYEKNARYFIDVPRHCPSISAAPAA